MPPAAAAAAGGTTRWCPTAEQLMILEEMYNRGGVRTPSAAQIQQITAHLSLYGRVEGKNVFYWFQNHKARDRQRLRRRLLSRQPQPLLQPPHQLYYQPYFHHPQQQQQQQHTYGLNAPSSFLHQGGSMYMEDYEAAHAMSNTWTKWGMREINGGDSCEMENGPTMRWDNGDNRAAMMREDMGPTCPHNSIPNNRPLKTLQLFPVTTTCTLRVQSTTTTS